MEIIRTVEKMQRRSLAAKRKCRRIGLVPTMGYLHEGHLSLLRRARSECDTLVVSIYVNPTQFSPNEDLDAYPRDLDRDERLCEKDGVDIIFYPSNDEMYPDGFRTELRVKGLSDVLCGRSRPTHFTGVVTIVAKLFNITRPEIAVFGQKDAQQAVVIRRMARDMNFPVRIIVSPTVREKDGLAKSSRNEYLAPEERRIAPVLFESLAMARDAIESGEASDSESLIAAMKSKIVSAGPFEIDYIEIVDPEDLERVENLSGRPVLVALAAKLGKTRLIDNIVVVG